MTGKVSSTSLQTEISLDMAIEHREFGFLEEKKAGKQTKDRDKDLIRAKVSQNMVRLDLSDLSLAKILQTLFAKVFPK